MSTTRTAAPDPNIGAVLALVAAVALIATVVAVRSGGDSAPPADVQFGAVRVTGDALAPMPEVGSDPAVGSPAPQILSERRTGTVSIEPGTDGPMVLAFVAHWCGFCQAEVPRLVELAADGVFDDVRLVAVATATDESAPNYPPVSWLAAEGWPGEVVYDDMQARAAVAYGLTSYPFVVLVDGAGEVVERLAGEQDPSTVAAAVSRLG